jgi:hypothetical protein
MKEKILYIVYVIVNFLVTLGAFWSNAITFKTKQILKY